MPDDADRASLLIEERDKQALLLRKPQLVPCGFCFWCGESVKPGALFCEPLTLDDAGCRDDWQKREDAKRRNGT